MGRTTARRAAAAYLLLQGVAVPVWWAALSASGAVRAPFEMGAPGVLDAFRGPDVLLAGLSVVAGLLALGPRRGAVVATALTAGAVAYGTGLTLAAVAAADAGHLGAAAMLLATAGSAVALALVVRGTAPDAPVGPGRTP